jgi:hypothetical protein
MTAGTANGKYAKVFDAFLSDGMNSLCACSRCLVQVFDAFIC